MGLKKPHNFVVEVGSVQRVRGPNFPTKTNPCPSDLRHRWRRPYIEKPFECCMAKKKLRGILTMGVFFSIFHIGPGFFFGMCSTTKMERFKDVMKK